nr:ATP-dependent helicase [bacterium]
TEEQRRAIEAVDRSLAVEGAAGSGKTSVLIGRIMRIVGDDWSRLARVLAITFTEKAAGELKARLRPLVPARERHLLEGAWIGTFHGFCARILRRHAPRIGLDPAFSIMEENSAMLERASAAKGTLVDLVNAGDEEAMLLIESVEFKTAVGALESLMEFRQHAKPALANAAGAIGWEKDALRALSSVFERTLERYRGLMAGLSSLDFEELEARALELISLPDVRESLSAKFDHILVDEFQDTSDAQTELVLALFDPVRTKLFIVGDEAQSIYRFRGANVGCFARVRKAIEKAGGESVRLSANFRSAPGIISFVNGSRGALSDGLFADPSLGELMEAGRLYGRGEKAAFSPAVRVIKLTSDGNAAQRRDDEARAIARHVAGLILEDGVYPGDVVCLFRALTSVAPYEAALRGEGVPAIVSGGRGLLGRREVADLMAALTFAADPRDERALLTLLRSPMFSLSDDEILLLSAEGGKLRDSAVRHPSCGALGELLRLAPHLRPSEFLRRAVDLTGYEAAVSRIDPSGGMAANVDRFTTMAQSIESELPIPLANFAGFVGDLRARSARLGDPPAAGDTARAVRLMSVHAAKGLEFPVVFLPDLFHGGSSHRDPWIFSRGGATGAKPGFAFKQRDPERPFDKPEATERFKKLLAEEKAEGELEMKRLLYVAMTRARDLLVLPLHGDASRAGPWHGWVESAVEAAAGKGGARALLKTLSEDGRSGGRRDEWDALSLFALPRGHSRCKRRA